MEDFYNSDYASLLSSDASYEVDDLLELSDEVFIALSNDKVDEALSMFFENLCEELLLVVTDIFYSAFEGYVTFEDQDYDYSNFFLRRGHVRIHLYADITAGRFVGEMVSTLIMTRIMAIVTSKVALGTITAGVAGLVVGATLGVAIHQLVNRLVHRGGEAGFRQVFIDEKPISNAIWFPFRINIERNLVDDIINLICFGGGAFHGGGPSASAPITQPPLRWATN